LGAALSLIWVLTIGGELVILAILPFLNFPLEVKILTPVMGAATLAVLHCSGYRTENPRTASENPKNPIFINNPPSANNLPRIS
jgi:hypothetical protein